MAAHPGADVLWTRTDRLAEVTQGGDTEVLAGAAALHEELCDLRFRISPEAFFQTNTETAELLYGLARDYAELPGSERVYDLYCGIGTLSLTLALRAGEVWGLDIVHEAIADAIENARLNEIDNVHFFAGDVRDALRPLAERAPRPDVVVVDPPRAGLSQKVVRRLLETSPRPDRLRVVQPDHPGAERAPDGRRRATGSLRCGPSTCSRTRPHIECVALLERERGAVAERPRGLGVAAGLDEEVARELARRCESLGYASMWSNDHPMASGLETVAVFADAAPALDVGVAVLALDRHEPARYAAKIRELGIPPERLWLGIGAGFTKRPLSVVREGLAAMRAALPRRDPRRGRRDGAEDVRARGSRGGRRVPQLDDAREGGLGARAGARGRARGGPCRRLRRSSATCGSRSAPTPRSGC